MNRNTAVRLGVSYAIVSIIIFLLQALLDGGMAVKLLLGLAALATVIAIPIIFIRKNRMDLGGYISFWAVFKLTFTGLLIGGVISTVFSLAYITYIDQDYPEKVLVQALESQKKFMQSTMSRDQMEEIMQETEESIVDGFTPVGMAKTFMWYALFYLVLSLIFAAFMKKDPPPTHGSELTDSAAETNPAI